MNVWKLSVHIKIIFNPILSRFSISVVQILFARTILICVSVTDNHYGKLRLKTVSLA